MLLNHFHKFILNLPHIIRQYLVAYLSDVTD